MAHVITFRNLLVYILVRQLSQEIFETRKFPSQGTYALTGQVWPSSWSVSAQIAATWANGKYEKHLISILTDVDNEQQETQYWTETAFDRSYIPKKYRNNDLSNMLPKLPGSMMAGSSSFCKKI